MDSPTIEDFFHLLFQHSPVGSFFYSTKIFKQVQEARPKFHREYGGIINDLKLHKETESTDFYFSPASYRRPTKAIKANVGGAGCVWVDCDAGLPEFEEHPSVIIETSPNHFHAYWILNSFRVGSDIETINRFLASKYNTDRSGWDSTQLLRPPGSFNRKRNNVSSTIVGWYPDQRADFLSIQPEIVVDTSKSLETILAEEVFTKRVRELIFDRESDDRSGLIFQTACELIKMGLTDEKILILLKFQDGRLGKFTKRENPTGELERLIKTARIKTKVESPKELTRKASVRVHENERNFHMQVVNEEACVVNGFLPEQGILIVGGEPGVGKSRFILNMLDSIALGNPFLNQKVERPRKCGYLSLDMPDRQVKRIRVAQQVGYKQHEVNTDLLETNTLWLMRGSRLDLNDPDIQAEIQGYIIDYDIEVMFIDILGKAVQTLLDDIVAQKFIGWMQELSTARKMAWILVSHTRKVPAGITKLAINLDDLFGSRHWSMTPDTILVLGGSTTDTQTLYVVKDRIGVLGESMKIRKDPIHSLYSLISEVKNQDSEESTSGPEPGIPV